jgi:hypothetical protein
LENRVDQLEKFSSSRGAHAAELAPLFFRTFSNAAEHWASGEIVNEIDIQGTGLHNPRNVTHHQHRIQHSIVT